jgi:predicted enzyme related to lactoylglutathione lyase
MTITDRETAVPERREHPAGVPCWVDLEVPDPAEAMRFYAGLFEWEFDDTAPPGAGGTYFVARQEGEEVAGIALRSGANGGTEPQWNMYVCVDDADATLARVRDAGGTMVGDARELPGAARVASVRSLIRRGRRSGCGSRAGIRGCSGRTHRAPGTSTS